MDTTDKILNLLKNKGYTPNEIDEESISFWVSFHEMEPMALAQKVAEETGLHYKEIFEIL